VTSRLVTRFRSRSPPFESDPQLGNVEVFQISTRPVGGMGPTTYFYGTIVQP
jgi:hypothetical protein